MPASRRRLATLARPFLAGLIHSVLMVLAFPPFGWWPLAFVAILPLVWAAAAGWHGQAALGLPVSDATLGSSSTGEPNAAHPWHPAWLDPLLVTLGTVPLWAYEQVWIIDVSNLGYYPFIVALAAFAGGFLWVLRRMVRRWPGAPLTLLVPIAWTGVESLHGEVIGGGYPWMLLGHPLIDWAPLAAPASVLGAYGVTFLAATVSGAVADLAFRTSAGRPALVGMAAAGTVWAGSALFAPMGAAGPGPVRVAVVQTNIPQDNKNAWTPAQRLRDFDRFAELTRQAAGATPRPSLIVWPETMFPGLALDPWFAEHLERRAAAGQGDADTRSLTPIYRDTLALEKELGIPLLIGAAGYDRVEQDNGGVSLVFYNSAFLIERGAVSPIRYDKIQLTPFGEVMPYIEYWPWLQKKLLSIGANGMDFNLKRGTVARTFTVPTPQGPVSVGSPICFEGTTTRVNRDLVRQRADIPSLLINLTNDGWFGNFDPARWQHLQNARWRCVELGVPMVRAANTGVSCSIDGRGRVLKSGVEGVPGATRIDGVLLVDVQPATPTTVYSRVGRLFAWVTLGTMILLLVGTYVRGRASGRAPG